jgi:curved DNA-binding protein CbpA
MTSSFQGQNYYSILGMSQTATTLEIRKAFRKLALTLHPDKIDSKDKTQSTIDFQFLVNVVDILTDTEKREYYDLTGDDKMIHECKTQKSTYYTKRYVDIEQILAHQEKYVGSQEEQHDVYEAYKEFKGNMTAIIETIMHSTDEDIKRFTDMIQIGIHLKLLPTHEIFRGPSTEISVEDDNECEEMTHKEADVNGYFDGVPVRPDQKEQREQKEQKEGKTGALSFQSNDTKVAASNVNNELAQPIMSMRDREAKRIQDLCSSLEKRYRPKNYVDVDITEEEFQRTAQKLAERRNKRKR